jgi:hypothetical protein
MSKRFEAIYRIVDECEEAPDRLRRGWKLCRKIIYPLLLCLSDDELIELYFECSGDKRLFTSVENLIRNKIESEGHAAFVPLVEKILSMLPEADWHLYRRLRTFLSSIIAPFPKEFISEYFSYFYKSEKISDRWKAYAVAHLIWSDEVEGKLWRRLYEDPDESLLIVLADKGDPDSLAEIFQEVWQAEHIQFWVKNKILVRLAPTHFKAVARLKGEYPVSYMYAAILAGKKLSQNQALSLALKAKDAREFGFALWCLGKLKMWNALVELSARLPELQDRYDLQELGRFGITDLHAFDV